MTVTSIGTERSNMGEEPRLEAEQGARGVETFKDIVDIVRHAMEALQPNYRSKDKQLVYDELASILDFFEAEYT